MEDANQDTPSPAEAPNDVEKQGTEPTSTPSSEASANPHPSPPAVEEKQEDDAAAAAEKEEDAPYRYPAGRVPEDDAWFFSRLFFFWALPLFRRAAYLSKDAKGLEHEDLLPLPQQDHGAVVGKAFEDAFDVAHQKAREAQAATGKPVPPPMKLSELKGAQGRNTSKVQHAVGAVIGWEFWLAGLIKVVNTCLQFSFPLLLNEILSFIEDTQSGLIAEDAPGVEKYRGYWLSALLFVFMAAKAVTENVYFHRVYRAGYQSRVAVSVAVYNKSLRLANAERQDTTLGELINLMQVDATKIEMFVPQIHVLWDGLLQITGYMTILYTLIGWPCFAGMALMIGAGPVQGIIMGKMFGENHKMAKFTDKRVKTTNEALQGIQCVKMYTWEESFQKAIDDCRNGELDHLSNIAYLRAFSRAYMSALPGLVAVLSFVVYAVAIPDANIAASTLFAALAAFDQLRFPLLFYPMALAQLSQAQVSAARVETFLGMKEVGKGSGASGKGTYNRLENASPGEIIVNDATIYWSDPDIPISKNDDDDSSVTSSKSINSKKSTSSKKSKKSESTAVANESEALSTSDVELVYPKPVLNNVSFQVKPGELTAVVGRVASGKSTLCSSVLNETVLGGGDVTLKGKVAFAAQTPWILNATLRDNILFGLPMNRAKYDRVLLACQLTYDLELLEQGDMTEIGERGINLSGGQKQRVSVARAAYSDADTIILDDPLSALDPEVGKKLLEECVVKLMHGKTRLLVTNQLQFLQQCDNIVALGHGEIVEQGTFENLTAQEGGEVHRILQELEARKEAVGESKSEDSGKKKKKKKKKGEDTEKAASAAPAAQARQTEEKGLVTKEERNVGAVAASVYKKYMRAGGGIPKFSVVYFAFILSSANALAMTSWVSFWTTDPTYEANPQAFYLGMYALLAVTLGAFTYLRTYLLVKFGVDASRKVHEDLLKSILNAPMSFFDTTPIGRILSRFSKDLYSIDVELVEYMDFFAFMSLSVCVSLGTIIFVTPWFAIAVIPLAFVYFKVLNYFRNVARETKRLESVSRSPVYAQFSESLGGLTTIRAYGQGTRFVDEFEGKVDHNIRAWYCNKAADRWLSVRLEMIGSAIAGLAAFFAANVAISGSGNDNFASLAGLSLTFAISVTSMLNWCVRTFAQLEAAMNACERVLYYTEEIPREAARTSEELEKRATSDDSQDPATPSAFAVQAKGGKTSDFSKNWPDRGAITLNNLKMRYRKDTPLVLKGLSVAIEGGERIGVVGRTGSGKSSLLLTLLRLVEPALDEVKAADYTAPLTIDGVDALRVGLKELRSKLGIIPQNPVLFSGTIRSNVDPFDEYTDDQIWGALERCGMKVAVEEMPGMLGATVSEYGENLSAGSRQMLVLGRALLKQCRILLLDEATSSVDYETDREIQRTIREAFPGCTVLTIAHRINTIMDSTKILVMKDGLAAEFAPPQELLQDETSIFADIVRHSQQEEE